MNPRSSHQIVYWACPGARVRGSRAMTPARKRSAPGPENRYLNSGDVSNTPAELRTAKYSNFSDSPYFSAARWPDQWLHSPVSFSADVRSWNGVVRIMRGALPPLGTRTVADAGPGEQRRCLGWVRSGEVVPDPGPQAVTVSR